MHGQPSAGPRNRLVGESSPYLLQHAANPVDWYPWGDAAIARARELGHVLERLTPARRQSGRSDIGHGTMAA